ncbi:hypothetical protein RB594_003940 [Gaeumannomyces avenae]
MMFTLYSAVAIVFAASCATATPMALPDTSIKSGLSTRATSIGLTADEFLRSNGTCRDVTLLYARGSIQPGNLGDMPGTTLANQLRERLGADRAFSELITNVTVACPQDQDGRLGLQPGRAALVHAAVRDMPRVGAEQRVRARPPSPLATRARSRTAAPSPPLPEDETLILCHKTDLTCKGTLVVTPSHLSYNGKVPEAVDFIAKRCRMRRDGFRHVFS